MSVPMALSATHVVVGRAGDLDAVVGVAGDRVLANDGIRAHDPGAADHVVVGRAGDQDAVAAVGEDRVAARVQADDVGNDRDARGIAGNFQPVVQVARDHVGLDDLVAAGRGDQHAVVAVRRDAEEGGDAGEGVERAEAARGIRDLDAVQSPLPDTTLPSGMTPPTCVFCELPSIRMPSPRWRRRWHCWRRCRRSWPGS